MDRRVFETYVETQLPDDIGALKAALIAARAELATEKAKAMAVGAELARAGW
jgi:hypothetical protein